jgi:hypothetical protein
MGASERSQQWRVMHHAYTYERSPGAGFLYLSDLASAVGLSEPAARHLIDRCVREQLAYLFATAADPCVGLTAAGRAFARAARPEA